MIVTEEEAKTKLAIRQGFNGCGTYVGLDNHDCPIRQCAASVCMAWRSAGWRDKGDGSISKDSRLADPKYAVPVGYCGLAGTP